MTKQSTITKKQADAFAKRFKESLEFQKIYEPFAFNRIKVLNITGFYSEEFKFKIYRFKL